MISQQEIEINQYNLTILSVKMKVKFPCKMKLQHSSNPITEDVESKQHSKFLFNQEVTIQEPASQPTIDFNIILLTEKGSRYVSGVVKLSTADLQKAEGQKIITPLAKCLDNQAYCELKINKVKIGKIPKRISVSSTLIEMKKLNSESSIKFSKQETDLLSPKNKRVNEVETRSEIGFGGLGIKNGHNEWDDTKSKGAAQTLIYRSSFLKSPKSKKPTQVCSPKSRIGGDFNQEYEILTQRDKQSNVDSEVYREGYQKLKQKYKAQCETLNCEQSKRQQLQANQNNYKVQIMRLKLKTEQQQRIITQKNEKINQLQLVISEINKQDLDMDFLKQENKNLEEKIQMMNDVIGGLKKDNLNVRKLYEDRQQNDNLLVNELRAELQSTKQKLQSHSTQSAQTIRKKTQQILSLTNDTKSKANQILLQRQEIYKLQAYNQQKIYQFQKTLQQQKNASSQTANQLKQKIQLLERDKKLMEKEINQLKGDKEKIKALILKAEYDKKILQQEQKVLKGEVLEYKTLKEKHNQLKRQLTILSEDNSHLRKQLQLQSQSKQINLQQINQQYELKLNYYKKQAKQFQEKHKLLANSKIQLQSQLQIGTNSIQKLKRQLQSGNNELLSVKNTLKQSKQYSNQLEQQTLHLQNDLAITNNKMRFGEQTSRIQIEKYRADLQKVRNELSAENAKAIQLFEQKSNLQIQLNKNTIQLQYHQDKIDKLFTANKQYQAVIEHMTKEHQNQLNDLNEDITKLKAQLKHAQAIIHSAELEKITFTQKIQSNKKQLKLNQEKILFLQAQVKSRLQDISVLEEKLKSQQKTLSTFQNQHSLLKHDHSILKNDLSKAQKISQLKSQQIQSLKNDYKKLQQQKDILSKVELQLRDQIKKSHQNCIRTQMKLKSTQRQYNKFKQLINRTVKTQYAKLPLLQSNSLSNQQQHQNSLNLQQKDLTQRKRQLQHTNNNDSKVTVILNGSAKEIQITPQHVTLQALSTSNILSQLTTSITQSKTTLFKLIEHNKQLKKEIQSLKEQSQQSSSKHQFTQIQLHKQLQQLQDELNNVYGQKQQQIINYDKIVSQLNSKLHDKQNLCDQLTQQVQQLQYALSSLKLDFQTNNTKNDKKVLLLKQVITELQEKVQFFKVALSNQQDTNHELEEKVEILKGEKEQLTELSVKNKSIIDQLTNNNQKLQKSYQQLIKQRKSLVEKLNQTQIQLNQQQTLKQKSNLLLQQQQKKIQQLKQFVSQLMKKKQNIIKSELQKSDRILQLETIEIQLKRDVELAGEQLQRYKCQLQQNKQKYRKQFTTSKHLQSQLTQSLSKYKKASQKLQQKQKQIQMKDQIISRLDKKYKQLTQKNYKQTLQLHSQIDSKYSQNINISKQLNQKILLLEAKIEELEHIRAKQHHQCIVVNDQLLVREEELSVVKRQQQRLQSQMQEIRQNNKSLENRNQQLTQQIELRQEQLSQFNQRVIVLQGELQALNKDNQLKLQQLNQDWTRKYDSLIQEHNHKLDLVQNQRQMLRSQLQQKINQLQLSNNHQLNSQLGLNNIKLNYQEKIKKIQNDRLNAILAKNNQIKKLTDQNLVLNQNLTQLQAAQKQNSQLLENIRKRLMNQEKLRKDQQEKYKSTNKLLQAEIGTLLAKQATYTKEKQQLYQAIWSNEREVRKTVQNYLKKVLDQCDNVHIDKITNSTKGLEAEVVKAMTYNLSPTAN